VCVCVCVCLRVDIHCGRSLEFPPFSQQWDSQVKSPDGTMIYSKDNRALLLEVKTFLEKAHNAKPLKRIKVLFLVRHPSPRTS